MSYYQNIYTALRSAMIDRGAGDKEEDAVLIDFVSAQVALKREIPSPALLISYSMLYYPGWLLTADPSVGKVALGKPIEQFIGGRENLSYPILFNIHMGMIALAVGCYAGFLKAHHSSVLQTVMVNPNMDNPLVRKTYEVIKAEGLDYTQAREVFLDLMQQEEYSQGILLADDFIANASFIQEAKLSVDNANEYMEQVKRIDLSKQFGGFH